LARIQNNNRLIDEELKAKADGYRLVAGIDEAGRGPLAGPVVAASVVLKDYSFSCVIDDSKKLSARARQLAYGQILDKAFVGIGIVAEDDIDRINIYRATLAAMQMSVLDLYVRPDLLLIDGNMRLRLKADQKCIIRGDQKSLSIACASIVAKVTRDRLLEFYDRIFPGYGFGRHKGYGTRGHMLAIRRMGYSPVHRRSFGSIIDMTRG